MEVVLSDRSPCEAAVDAVVIGVFADKQLDGPAAAVNEACGGTIQHLLDSGELSGRTGEVVQLWSLPGVAATQIALVGLGERERWGAGACAQAAGTAARRLAAQPRGDVLFALGEVSEAATAAAGIAAAMAACHGQDLYRAERKLHPFKRLLWSQADTSAVERGKILGDAVNLTRQLVNEPPAVIYPETFAERAVEIARATGLEAEVWDADRLQAERMGALLAVARGSSRPPRVVILRHRAGGEGKKGLFLVGKGVTFDSGGLSLKSNDSMKDMKCDMAGAATVLGAMQAIARLDVPHPVVGIMGLVENMPGSAAMKLGDVLTARNGRTIEVMNTDAEGRLVLADALALAVDQGADRIIDLATLTGACMVALGTDVVGLMSNDPGWSDQVRQAADACGELCWPLPMFSVYDELIQSDVADIKNSTGVRWAGAITAAKFLAQFVGEVPWTHLDIAGPAFLERPKPWLDGGATGVMVRTLVEVVERLSKATG